MEILLTLITGILFSLATGIYFYHIGRLDGTNEAYQSFNATLYKLKTNKNDK